ncbi:MAG: hypothetical protein H6716_27355, partial [Polyangiaceae bacterium]|nr:hypothetical protein [Polyangiaceae bacterium]
GVPVQSGVLVNIGSGGGAGVGGFTIDVSDKAPDGYVGRSLDRLVM